MKRSSDIQRMGWAWVCAVLVGLAARTSAGAVFGEAIVVASSGQTSARVLVGPVHEGRTQVVNLYDATSIGETSRAITGRDGWANLVCTPGAIVCMAPRTEFTFDQLRHTAEGLPQRESDLFSRVHLDLHQGRIRVRAGQDLPTLDVRIRTPAGTVEAQGGTFNVAKDDQNRWYVYSDVGEVRMVPLEGDAVVLQAGQAARMWVDEEGAVQVASRVDPDVRLNYFELCDSYFGDLDPLLFTDRRFDRAGLESFLGTEPALLSASDITVITDVSPTIRPQVATTRRLTPPTPVTVDLGGRWPEERIWRWFDSVGPIKGVNYQPRTVGSSYEMWAPETFDTDVLKEELGWAREVGYNAVRVQMEYRWWQEDPGGFLQRVEELVKIAADQDLRVVPILFKDIEMPDMVQDRSQWPRLEQFVQAVMDEFKRDERVLYWDLYNTAGSGELWEEALPLVDQMFIWARAVESSQPLAIPAWKNFGSAMTHRKFEKSDLITFQSYDSPVVVESHLERLQHFNRPIVCSSWLDREKNNSFEEVLPLFAAYRVGWFSEGLVMPSDQVQEGVDWRDHVLNPDGTPWNRREVELIQGFRFF